MTARRPYLLVVSAVTLAVLATACGEDGGPTTQPPTSPPVTSAPASPTPSATAATPSPTATGTMTVRVYYLHDLRFGPRLQRETRVVPRSTGVVRAAVEAMLHVDPLDPDYRSLWPDATRILGVSISADTATVDLSREARTASAGAEAEQLSLQQLVWTVTEAAPAVRRVQLRIEGAAPETLWGHVDTRTPMTRDDHNDVLAPISMYAPQQGDTVARTFTFSGTSNTFEANLQWRVSSDCRPGTTCTSPRVVYRSGFTTATSGTGTRGTWSVTVTLPANAPSGWIEVRAFESSAEDGTEQFTETKIVRFV